MRHRNSIKKLGRERNQRRALLKSLARSLILEERIKTGLTKARVLRPLVEKLISRAKRKSPADQRLLTARVGRQAARKLINELGPRFEKHPGGYTRIVKLSPRISDGSSLGLIELIKN